MAYARANEAYTHRALGERTAGKRLELHWHRGDASVDFRELPLTHPTMARGGVYVIHRDRRAHRLGQATRIFDRLRAHQQDPRIVQCSNARLAVWWALVPRAYRNGVEAYLGRALHPDVAERFPTEMPIVVNLPSELELALVGKPDVRSATASPFTGEQDLAYPSSFMKTNAMDESTSGDLPARQVSDALERLAWLHSKDAKNSANHWANECPMCDVFRQLGIGRGLRHIDQTPSALLSSG